MDQTIKHLGDTGGRSEVQLGKGQGALHYQQFGWHSNYTSGEEFPRSVRSSLEFESAS